MSAAVYVDDVTGFNSEIIDLFAYKLGEAPSSFVAYFERCVEGLSQNPDGKGQFKGNPVYANPNTGIIMAAVIGACGVALRVSQTVRPTMLQAGGKEYIQVEGSKQRLGNARGDIWEGWIVSDGALNPDEVRQALAELHPVLARAQAKKIERNIRNPAPGPLEQPANGPILDYLKALPPGAGSSHPEFAEDFFQGIPRQAGIDPAGVVGNWVNKWPVLLNRASGIVFGYYNAKFALVLKVPESVRLVALEAINSKGQHYATAFPEIGQDWIVCTLSTLKEYPQWLESAYKFAEPRQQM